MTMGELARFYNTTLNINARLADRAGGRVAAVDVVR